MTFLNALHAGLPIRRRIWKEDLSIDWVQNTKEWCLQKTSSWRQMPYELEPAQLLADDWENVK